MVCQTCGPLFLCRRLITESERKVTNVEIDCASVKAKLDAGEEFLFLDCRETSEYETAKIEGTTLIPMGEIPSRVEELEAYRNQTIIVHCHHGGRSLNVANWLKNQGFADPLSMAGGIDVWSQEIDSTIPRY